jgi:O-antigen/teichoic acid export membrane protein
MLRPIRALPDPTMGWIAWFVVLAVSGVALWGSCYAALLQGANEVAVLRRWETMTSAAAIVTSLVVLLRGGGLLSLVIANQGWMLVSVARNRMLAVPLLRRATLASRADPEVMRAVWSSAWRSGLGVAIGRGVTHVSGFLLAQLAQPAVVAAYLLALRLLQLITEFSAAPFYSRLPVLARLNAEGLRDVQLTQARRGMTLSLWAFVLAAWVVALTAHPALEAINSQVSFVAPSLWVLLATSLFIERFGAMHLQLFSTTNRIVWHVANGVSGAIYLVVSLALMRSYGAYAFAWGSFAGAAGFYAWYSARHSYREFRLRFWSFERSVALPPAVAMTALCVAVWAGWLR